MNLSYNYVDNTPVSGGSVGWTKKLDDNTRIVQNEEGPSNVDDKVLGHYWFTANVGESGETYFYCSGIKFTATDGTEYRRTNHNLVEENQTFNIVAPCWADRTGSLGKRDGRVNSYDLDEFKACFSGPTVPHSEGCEWANRDGDNDVDLSDFAKFQRCFSGEALADPSCAE